MLHRSIRLGSCSPSRPSIGCRPIASHGATDDETLSAIDVSPQYGCRGFGEALGAGDDEAVLIGLSRFRDRVHHDAVMERVNADPRIDTLSPRSVR